MTEGAGNPQTILVYDDVEFGDPSVDFGARDTVVQSQVVGTGVAGLSTTCPVTGLLGLAFGSDANGD